MHRVIREELNRRSQGYYELYDPVTNSVIRDDQRAVKDSAIQNVIESFSPEEQLIVRKDDGICLLRNRILLNLGVTTGGMVGMNVVVPLLHLPKVFDDIILVW